MEILGLVTSVLSGGATGLIGVVLQRWMDYKNKKLDIELLERKNAHDLAIMDREWAGRVKVAEVEGAAKVDVEDAKALASSYQGAFERQAQWDMSKDPWYFKMWPLMADFLRNIVRPGLTVYLCVLTTLVYIEARGLVAKEDLDATAALAQSARIVETILYLTTTCVLWWFGTRNRGKTSGT